MKFMVSVSLLLAPSVEGKSETGIFIEKIVKSLAKDGFMADNWEAGDRSRQLSVMSDESKASSASETGHNPHRRFSLLTETGPSYDKDRAVLEGFPSDQAQKACDSAFLNCLPSVNCLDCFASLQEGGIDWVTLTPDTTCHEVLIYLNDAHQCSGLSDDNVALDTFCATFNSCVVWEDLSPSYGHGPSSFQNDTKIDCSNLTSCEWDGIHRSFLGDGICHDNLPGCYNSAVCRYDGGDCCEDTCASTTELIPCGSEGYACRDPTSEGCDPLLSSKCENSPEDGDKDNGVDPESVECKDDETKYRLMQYDSFGDGWDDTKLSLTPVDNGNNVIYTGGLVYGSTGVEYICLSRDSQCYHVKVAGGTWGKEVSWEIKPMGEGTLSIAAGGAPMDCTFNVGGAACDRTCIAGKSNVEPDADPEYKTYKKMFECMQKKCLIQVGACKKDPACEPCFAENSPEYCFGNDNFNAVLDCSLCNCDGSISSEFCAEKVTPGTLLPPIPPEDEPSTAKPCTASQTLQGSAAVVAFSKCTELDEVSMMVTDFSESNFGMLDQFEACAHSFNEDIDHGGHTALSCLSILVNAINDPTQSDDSNAPASAISTLANKIYHNGEDFCNCTSQANQDCPLCPSFSHFKTLLYESLDACKALDEIDCAAWKEFYNSCKSNLLTKFGTVNFDDPSQCTFIRDSCGGAGPFPKFRKLDCGPELPDNAWDVYNLFSEKCLKDGGGSLPPSPPIPVSHAPSPLPTGFPTEDDVVPETKPYVPPEEDSSDSTQKPYTPNEEKTTTTKKKRHIFRNLFIICLVAGAAYGIHRRRQESFSFVRYRRARNYGAESEMYSGLAMGTSLTMDSASNAFEPPSLPPPPSAMDNAMT